MKFTSTLPILAALAFSTSAALAEPAAPPSAPDRAAMHSQMCVNHLAGVTGKLAALEVRLSLTAAQKSAFERWKQVKLAAARAESAKCTEMTPLGHDASIIEHRQRQIANLEARLADLKTETPALEALVRVLTPDQQRILLQAGRQAEGERMMGMHGGMGRGHGPMMQRMEDHRGGPAN
jgi:hypothetical protein